MSKGFILSVSLPYIWQLVYRSRFLDGGPWAIGHLWSAECVKMPNGPWKIREARFFFTVHTFNLLLKCNFQSIQGCLLFFTFLPATHAYIVDGKV